MVSESAFHTGTASEKSGLLDSASHAKQKCEWGHSYLVIIASMLGTGILGLPFAMRQTGWLLGSATMVVTLGFSIYSGLLLGRLYRKGEGMETYAELTYEVCRARWSQRVSKVAEWAITCLAYSYLFGVACICMTAMKISLQELVFAVRLSDALSLFATMVLVFSFSQNQSLREASYISALGVGTILVVNIFIVTDAGRILLSSEAGAGATEVFAPGSDGFHVAGGWDSMLASMNGVTTIIFAFGGHVIFLEIISEMRKPADFSIAVWSSQLTMMANYVAVAALGTCTCKGRTSANCIKEFFLHRLTLRCTVFPFFFPTAYLAYGVLVMSPVTLNLPQTTWISFTANICLLLHVLVAYCIDCYVLCTAAQRFISSCPLARVLPPIFSDRNSKYSWAIYTAGLILSSALISFLIPAFSDLMSLWSSIGICSLSFAVPALLWLIANYENMSKISVVVHVSIVALATAIGICGFGASANNIYLHLRTTLKLLLK